MILPEPDVVLYTANSELTLSSSTPDTRNEIRSVIGQLDERYSNTTRSPDTGHFITSVGDKRIVWKRLDGNRVLVLTIFSATP